MKTGYASLRPGSQATPALGKKEHAEKEVSPLRRRPTLRALDWRSLFEKNLRKPLAVYSVSLLRKHQRRKNFPADNAQLTYKSKFEFVKRQKFPLTYFLSNIPKKFS